MRALTVSTIVSLLILFVACAGKTTPEEERLSRLRGGAKIAVKKLLVSPTSAEFPPGDDPSYIYAPNLDGTVTVSGIVDSKNRLGVMIRLNWEVVLEDLGEGNGVRLVDAKLVN